MECLFLDTDEAAQQVIAALTAMGAQARNLLSECIANQGVKRKKVSAIALALENAGFVFIREQSGLWNEEVEICPSIMGEKAMELYEDSLNPSSSPGF